MGITKLFKFACVKSGLIAGIVAAFFVTSVQAQDAIADRKAMMQAVGASMKASGAMAKGQKPFDAGTAELAMRAMNAVALGIDGLAVNRRIDTAPVGKLLDDANNSFITGQCLFVCGGASLGSLAL